MKVGVIRNPRSHANLRRGTASRPADLPAEVCWAEPPTPGALIDDMQRFAAEGVELVVVDGGDGTVREVLSAMPKAFGDAPPALAVLASGKTNVLALDLGAGAGWSLPTVLRRAAEAAPVFKTRPPLEVSWPGGDQPPIRGFIFGLGAFARGTRMSQSVHRMGAYHNLSVALTVSGAALGTLFGGTRGEWSQGVEVTLATDGAAAPSGRRFVLMATTLKRLPFGLKPFGPPRDGMKVLDVDAPPRRLAAALPAILMGRGDGWLTGAGYRRREAEHLALSVAEPVVIDGEVFPGGDIVVRRGAPVRFLAP
jgi:diacylglycerol kinase (ATP)